MYKVTRLERLTARKCESWDHVPFVTDDQLSDEDILILGRKQKFTTNRMESPTPFDIECKKWNLPEEFILEMLGGEEPEYFYVVRQGYDYARYTFKYNPRSI